MANQRLSWIMTFVTILLSGTELYPQGTNVELQILSETAIDFTADQSSFTLTFTDFTSGSTTNAVDVNYSVMANDVVRTEDVVLAKLDDTFPDIAFQGQFSSYNKRDGNAHLVAAESGPVTITTEEVGLADKMIDEADGKMLDGTFVIRYQAKALQDQAAGEHIRTLTITLAST